MSDKKKLKFHNAEIAVQEKLGVADMVAQYSEGFVRPAMPDQHRDFFNKLITIIIKTATHGRFLYLVILDSFNHQTIKR